MRYSSVLCVLVFLWVALAHADELIRRGTATMMKFDGEHISKRDRGTWYSGKDLKNAACYGREGLPRFSAQVSDMIGAMAMRDFEYCYRCMEVTNQSNKRQVTVKIVDKCAACKVGTAIDLTPGAFKHLSSGLDTGVLNIHWKVVPCPDSIELGIE